MAGVLITKEDDLESEVARNFLKEIGVKFQEVDVKHTL